MNLFANEFEQEAIDRIKRFALLAQKMGYSEPVLGFSGGKDSQVIYDLCKRSGIKFIAKFNHCFESNVTMNFIREYYPDVEWRRIVKQGFIDNIRKNHSGMFPTVEAAFCCKDYKHNHVYLDAATIVGVRRAESAKRASRQVLETKNKTLLKKNKETLTEYFKEGCIASGSPAEITLYPIVDWSDKDVWDYIHSHNLPVNPEYQRYKRVGCLVCPKSDLNTNYIALIEHPKLIDCFIKVRTDNPDLDWYIKSDCNDYSNNKVEYICRWLNHSFRPFTKRQQANFEKVKEAYNKMKQNER